jgi:hypothetical protein
MKKPSHSQIDCLLAATASCPTVLAALENGEALHEYVCVCVRVHIQNATTLPT